MRVAMKHDANLAIRVRRIALVCAVGLWAVISGRYAVAATPTTHRPNIILFISDDHGARDCGAYGDTVVRTPNIDRLAKQGMRFTHAFAESPLCSPSRCVIATGLSPFRNGGHKFGTPIRPGLRTMPMYFRELGYHTAHFGKFHHAPRKQFPYDKIDSKEKNAAAYLRRYDGNKPLLLVVCTRPPHTPWLKNKDYDPAAIKLPPNFIDTPQTRADRADYYTDVTEMDRTLGQVMDAIEATGIADDTLLIYTTDQGANWPFGKWCLYDAGIRVPLIVRWNGRVKAAVTSEALVSLADLLPTMMDAAGTRPPAAPKQIDGKSFLDVLRGATTTHRDAIFAAHTGNDNGGPGVANHCPTRSIRTARHKLIVNLHPERTFYTHIVGCKPGNAHHLPFWNTWVKRAQSDPKAKRIVSAYLHRPAVELYDLRDDPYEMHNLAADPAQANTLQSLRHRLNQWRRQQGDPEADSNDLSPPRGVTQ